MPLLADYKGLNVVSPDPTGDGGLAIQNDFKSLVDWNPRNVWSQSADPTAGDDQGDNFYPGSMWLRTDTTPPKLFVCRSSATGAAVWTRIELTGDGVPYTGATANVNLGDFQLTSTGLNAGFVPLTPNQAARIDNFWFPRRADLSSGWMLDYQDEFAFRDRRTFGIAGARLAVGCSHLQLQSTTVRFVLVALGLHSPGLPGSRLRPMRLLPTVFDMQPNFISLSGPPPFL